MAKAGYSGTPLSKKLGLKDGMIIWVGGSPQAYCNYFDDFPVVTECTNDPEHKSVDFIHLFCTSHEHLETRYASMKYALKKTGLMWISWPKKISNIKTDLTRESLRAYILERGLVDVKVCAIDEDWSALKFVYRVKER